MGWGSSVDAGIHILFTDTEGDKTVIKDSSIHDCDGPCIIIDRSWNVDFINNVVYKGLGKLMAMNDVL